MSSAIGSPQRLRDYFRDAAAAVDRGEIDVRPGLHRLGIQGLLALGADPDPADGGAFRRMAGIVSEIAAECLSSAFSLWSQRMVIEYLSMPGASRSTVDHRDALARGASFGTTAMAPAMRDVAGLEPLPVTARRVRGEVRLTGRIPWSSNLFPGSLVVLPARLDDGGRVVVYLRTTDTGVHVKPARALLALNATASGSILLNDAAVPDEAVLSTDLPNFVRAIRPSFLLLQTALCHGLAERSLTEARQRLTGLNECFAGEVESLDAAHDSVTERLSDLSERRDPERARELLQVRLDAMRLAIAATRLDATVQGGLGYAADSATARRLRESAFLPVQAPTEGHLRWELSRYA